MTDMFLRGTKRLALLAGLACLVATAVAIGPNNQTITPQWGAVVRILKNNTNAGRTSEFLGTGTIIANRNINGQGWYCVLTADHVLSTGGSFDPTVTSPGIAQDNFLSNAGNQYEGGAYNQGIAIRSTDIFGAASRIDLAMMFVNYGAYNPVNNLYVRNMVDDDMNFGAFSVIGYGNEMQEVARGYRATGNYGIQRYMNNVVNQYAAANTPTNYVFDGTYWKVLKPRANFAGSGVVFDGDSGSPLFNNGPAQEPGQGITYFSTDIMGVVSGGIVTTVGADRFADFNTDQWAVRLSGTRGTTDGRRYMDWLNEKCASLVPEPASLIAVAAGIATLAARRRKSKK